MPAAMFVKYSMVLGFIRETVFTHRKFFLAVTGITFAFLTLLDAYLYISLGLPLHVALIVALWRFFLYLPLSILFATYFTVLRNSIGIISKRTGTAGIFGGVSAVFFTILGCPPCLFGLLAILSSVGLLGGGLLFSLLYLQPYAGVFFTLSVVVMLVGVYVMSNSYCRLNENK
jgi:hypothetical protein